MASEAEKQPETEDKTQQQSAAEEEKQPEPEADQPEGKQAEEQKKPEETATNGDAAKKEADAETEVETEAKTDGKDDELKTRNWREKADEDRRRDGAGRGRGGRGGRGGFQKRSNRSHSKANYDDLPETDDPDEIRKQVEFYFSDANLMGDKFLLTQVGGSENRGVPVKVIHSFKRMRHFQPYSAVVEALKASETLNVTDKEEIVRKTPLPEGTSGDIEVNVKLYEDAARSRSVYAKGFGEEKATTQVELENFFEPYGPVNSVRLRRDRHDGLFKGSVFVEFGSDDIAKAFLELDPKPKYEERELKIMSKEAYVTQKAEDIKAGKIRPNDDDDSRAQRGGSRGRGGRGGGRGGNRGSRGRDRGGRGRGGRDDRGQATDSRKRGPADEGEQGEAKKSKTEAE